MTMINILKTRLNKHAVGTYVRDDRAGGLDQAPRCGLRTRIAGKGLIHKISSPPNLCTDSVFTQNSDWPHVQTLDMVSCP